MKFARVRGPRNSRVIVVVALPIRNHGALDLRALAAEHRDDAALVGDLRVVDAVAALESLLAAFAGRHIAELPGLQEIDAQPAAMAALLRRMRARPGSQVTNSLCKKSFYTWSTANIDKPTRRAKSTASPEDPPAAVVIIGP